MKNRFKLVNEWSYNLIVDFLPVHSQSLTFQGAC